MYRVLIFLLLLFSSGCVYSLGQQGGAPFKASRTFNTEDNVEITATASAELESYRFSKYLTVFYLEITNNSNKEIVFGSEDIVLIDEKAVQYNLLSPENAASIVRENSKKWYYPRISIGIGGGYHSGHFHYYGRHRFWPYRFYNPYHRFHYYDDLYYYPDYYTRSNNLGEIYSDAIFPGLVKPGATLKGFVYFKKLLKEMPKVSLDFTYGYKTGNQRKSVTFEFKR